MTTSTSWSTVDGYGLIQGYAALQASGTPIPQPVISAPSGGASITAGQSVNFSGACSVTGGQTIQSYAWNFGGGATKSTAQNPGNVSFASAGTYTVSFNCADSQGISNGIPPTVTVTVNPVTPPSSGKSGGGAFDLLMIAFLAALLAEHRWRTRKQVLGL